MTPENKPTTPNPADNESIAPELIAAALQAAEAAGCDVADVPVAVIAATAGISRSTLWRRLGGARDVLDNAVRAVGVDPGGKPPVRVRAIAAAAELIGASGLSATTLEAVAKRAGCSVYSLHAAFGGRDALITAVFEHDSPIREIEDYLCGEQDDFREKVRGFLATVAAVPTSRRRYSPRFSLGRTVPLCETSPHTRRRASSGSSRVGSTGRSRPAAFSISRGRYWLSNCWGRSHSTS